VNETAPDGVPSEDEPTNAAGLVYGIPIAEWQSAYASHVAEFPATRFVVTWDGPMIRIAFGHAGPPTDERGGRGQPGFTAAISMSPGLAQALMRGLSSLFPTSDVTPVTSADGDK
jgi:hypothetical protein